MTTLNISENQLNGVSHLFDALKKNEVWKQRHKTKLPCIKQLMFCRFFFRKGLTTLDLSSNHFAEQGARSLAEVLKTHKTLKSIDLSMNQIKKNGMRAIAEALKTNKV